MQVCSTDCCVCHFHYRIGWLLNLGHGFVLKGNFPFSFIYECFHAGDVGGDVPTALTREGGVLRLYCLYLGILAKLSPVTSRSLVKYLSPSKDHGLTFTTEGSEDSDWPRLHLMFAGSAQVLSSHYPVSLPHIVNGGLGGALFIWYRTRVLNSTSVSGCKTSLLVP